MRPEHSETTAAGSSTCRHTHPIEQAFAKLNADLRRIGARSFTSVFEAIGAVCHLYDPAECCNYFSAAGYASN